MIRSCLWLAVLMLAAMPPATGPAAAQTPSCEIDEALLGEIHPLTYAAAAIREKRSLRILVIGSGSTVGVRVGGTDVTSYAARLKDELTKRYPGLAVELTNVAKRGLTARQMLAQLTVDIPRLMPALVIWQTGTTEIVMGYDLMEFGRHVAEGLDMLRDKGADVVLVTPQFGPKNDLLLEYDKVLDLMARLGESRNAMIFRRHQIMQRYVEEGRFRPGLRGTPHQVREAEWLHQCLAVDLADMIAFAVAATPAQ